MNQGYYYVKRLVETGGAQHSAGEHTVSSTTLTLANSSASDQVVSHVPSYWVPMGSMDIESKLCYMLYIDLAMVDKDISQIQYYFAHKLSK